MSGRRAPALMPLLLLGGALACAGPSTVAKIRVTTSAAGADTRLTLHAGPDLKINARLTPALELADGRVLRFSSDRLTPDSAYFDEPPWALLPGRHEHVRGTLRASVCGVNELVCRSVTIRLD